MTLVLAVNGPDTIWLMADRRLSAKGRPAQDDGRKLMSLVATDGVALLGYAGLGRSAGGTEPADWMSAVLRGRNLPLEQCLIALGEAVKSQIPRQIARIPGRASHSIIVPAFVGDEARLYSIDIVLAQDRRSYRWRCTRHVHSTVNSKPPRLAIGGSGERHLVRDKRWVRPLLRAVRAHGRRKVSAHAVADELAKINDLVARVDASVGPRCVVMWRHSIGAPQRGGGAHQFYDGTRREGDSALIPAISHGMDVIAIIKVLAPSVLQGRIDIPDASAPERDREKTNAELAKLPTTPDEDLR